MAAEDCIEPVVQTAAYDWLKRTLGSKDLEAIAASASYILAYICSTLNWWAQPSGQKYILVWREAQKNMREDHGFSEYNTSMHMEELFKAIKAKDTDTAALHHMLMLKSASNYKVHLEYATRMLELAIAEGNLSARVTANAHVVYAKMLSTMDDNWLGQAMYRLCGEPLGNGVWEVPDCEQVFTVHTAAIKEVYSNPRTPPAWTQDGIHCSGKDTRFAGVLSSMVGCCNMYNRHGQLSPTSEWDSTSRSSQELRNHVYG